MKGQECDTVMYKKYTFGHRCLFFIHRSWITAPRAPEISWVERAVGASFVMIFGLLLSSPEITSDPWRWNGYFVIHNQPFSMTARFMLMRWFLETTQGWGLVTRETTHAQTAGTFRPIPWFVGRGERLEVESITKGQWFNPPCRRVEVSIKIHQRQGLESFWAGEHMQIWGGRCCRRRHRSSAPTTHALP